MKHICSYDRTFISDTFRATFTDIDGNTITADIGGASILIAVIPLDKRNGAPIYSEIIDTEENPVLYNIDYFGASINPDLGAVVIPNINAHRTLPENIIVSARVVEYTIDVWEGPYLIAQHTVTEETFKKFIHDNYEYYNKSDNYFAQTTSCKYFPVEKEYPRISYRVGYNKQAEPIVEEYGTPNSKIVNFYTSAKTLEDAEKAAMDLLITTPEEMLAWRQKRNQQLAEKIMKDYLE